MLSDESLEVPGILIQKELEKRDHKLDKKNKENQARQELFDFMQTHPNFSLNEIRTNDLWTII